MRLLRPSKALGIFFLEMDKKQSHEQRFNFYAYSFAYTTYTYYILLLLIITYYYLLLLIITYYYLLLLVISYLIILNQLWFVDVLLILCFVSSQTIRFKAVLLSWQMEEVVPQSGM